MTELNPSTPIPLCCQVGYPESTPVAIVEKASTPDQRTLVGDLTTIATVAEQHNAKPPAVIVVGEVRITIMIILVLPPL